MTTAVNPSATPTQPVDPTVTEEDRYLFDLQGYLVLRGALEPKERQAMLAALIELEAKEVDDSAWRKTAANGKQPLPTKETAPNFVRFNGVARVSDAFDACIGHPAVLPYLEAFMNRPQLGHGWTITRFEGGACGAWHRGYGPPMYSYRNGKITSGMLNTIFALTDNHPGDGGLAVIPGSHKNNIDLPWGSYKGLALPGSVEVTLDAGDILIFSESLLHTGLAKATPGRRSNLYFNYVGYEIGIANYSPEHNHHFVFPESLRRRMSPTQQALCHWMNYAAVDAAEARLIG